MTNLIGTLIAVLTLTSPVLLIRHFSPMPTPTQSATNLERLPAARSATIPAKAKLRPMSVGLPNHPAP